MKSLIVAAFIITAIGSSAKSQVLERFSIQMSAGLFKPVIHDASLEYGGHGVIVDGGLAIRLTNRISILAGVGYSEILGSRNSQSTFVPYEGDKNDTLIFRDPFGSIYPENEFKFWSFTGGFRVMPWPTDWPNTYIQAKIGIIRMNRAPGKFIDQYHFDGRLTDVYFKTASRYGSSLEIGMGQIFILSQHFDFTLDAVFRSHQIEYDKKFSGPRLLLAFGDKIGKASIRDIGIRSGLVYKF
ncbi:MAG: hypothetical protein KDC45_10985 [Bacteroidetes bacterium]|nr:hypothetical protein [Bacteroidota bacterium]